MYLGPKLVIRGVFLGIILLVVLSTTLTTGATPPPIPSALENDPDREIESSNNISSVISEKCSVNPKYPEKILQWCALITHYGEQNNLPPNLIAAIVWQESGGQPQVHSKSGAVGLMQVMPSDGIAASFMCINGPCFTNRPTISELEDPEFNIKYGTKMLARLHDRHGNIRDALKAYGPKEVGYYYADKVLGIYNNYID